MHEDDISRKTVTVNSTQHKNYVFPPPFHQIMVHSYDTFCLFSNQ